MLKLKTYIFFVVTITSINSSIVFSANERFRSIATGDWNATTTWEMSTNNGSTWIPATSTPDQTSGLINVRYPNTVSVTADVSADQLTIDSGSVSINTGIIFTLLDGSGDDITVLRGGSVTGAGTFRTQGALLGMILRNGSNFNVALKVNSGVTVPYEPTSPNIARLYGPVTVDTAATLSATQSGGTSYKVEFYGNLTNNGILTSSGSSSKTMSFKGGAMVNNGTVTTPIFNFDSVSNLSGSGTFTPTNDLGIGTNGNVTLLSNITFSPSDEFIFLNGGILNPNGFTLNFTSGTLTINSGASITNSGLFKTQNDVTLNIRGGSSFNAPLNVSSGITRATDYSSPNIGRLYGPVTVDAGATLSATQSGLTAYKLELYGNLTNNGTLTAAGTTSKTMSFKGAVMVNNGTVTTPVFAFDSTTNLSGTGSISPSNDLYIGANGKVTLLTDVNFAPVSQFILNTGGNLNPNGFTVNYTSGALLLNSAATIMNSGLFRTQNAVIIDLRDGSFFNVPLKVNTGTTTAYNSAGSDLAKLYGSVTVDAGAVLSVTQSGLTSYKLEFYGNLTNNGTLISAGASGKTMTFKGASMVNNGTVSTAIFNFDSTSSLSGTGTFTTSNNMGIGANGNVTLLSNAAFSTVNQFIVTSGGTLNPNGFSVNYTSGEFVLNSGSTVVNSGLFRTQNSVTLTLKNGSFFNAPLRVNTGTTAAYEPTSPYIARIYGPVTVDTGATLSGTQSGLTSYKLELFGNMTNNGTLTAAGSSGKTMTFKGVEFVNNGLISTPIVNLDTNLTLSGTGSFTTNVNILSNRNVALTTNHQFSSVVINTGSTFNIGSNTVKFSASNPIIQNGTFTNAGSRIEYNGTALQSVSTANINYYILRINNPAGATLLGDITIPDSLRVILGDLNLNGKIITLTSSAYMTETPGNTVFGTSGYITTTRNIGTPASLNVGGTGAILTASSNLGNTEVRRGHTVQTGLNGGTSIKRYYDITPANNTGLNATLLFKFDDSELNGKPEPSLKLFKSTNSGSTWLFQGGTVNIAANTITLPGITSFSRWSADSSGVSAAIGLIMEGFYNIATNNLNMTDTVRAYLRNTSSPYAVVDSAVGLLDSLTFKSAFQFTNATTGTYYIQLKHRNSLETWSKNGVNYIQDSTLNYDFTFAATQAYGNNEILKGTKYCLYSGDVTQDGFIDLTDVVLVYNASSAFTTGYVSTDVNGNSIVDLTDIIIASNNANNFIAKKTP